MHHPIASPSSLARRISCLLSGRLEPTCPDVESDFALEGTVAHWLFESALTGEQLAQAFSDRIAPCDPEGKFPINNEMVGHVNRCLDIVRQILNNHPDAELLVEQRVHFGDAIGVDGASGTADVIILVPSARKIYVIDLKYGRGVKVDPVENAQLMAYGLGAIETYGYPNDSLDCIFDTVDLMILQPRLNSYPHWETTVAHIYDFSNKVEDAFVAIQSDVEVEANPSPSNCRFCKAKAICPALRKDLENDFEALPAEQLTLASPEQLGEAMKTVELHEQYAKAVRAEVERVMLRGFKVPGFKLVQGRKGPRKWDSEQAVIELLKSMRLKHDHMFKYTLVSPTQLEELHANGVLGKRQWTSIQPHVTQSEGRVSVAPVSDDRPGIQVAMDFEPLS